MDNQDVNQNQIIDEGKSVDDAIQKGLERLGITREEAEVEILDEGSRGVLNLIGGKNARVMVTRKDDTSAVSAKIRELLTNVLDLMDLSCQVTVRTEDDIHMVKVDTAGADGLLIEVHHAPDRAWSDGEQTLGPAEFRALMTGLQAFATAADREL